MRKSPTRRELRVGQGRIMKKSEGRAEREKGPARSSSFFHCGPALFHQAEQVRHGFLVSAALLFGQLTGAFVQLGSHLACFVGRTTHLLQDGNELIAVHDAGQDALKCACRIARASDYFTALAATILMLSTLTRTVGLLGSPLALGATGVSPIFPSTSSPLLSLPNAVYCRSRKLASPRQMKNWLPAELGSCERAIESTPR